MTTRFRPSAEEDARLLLPLAAAVWLVPFTLVMAFALTGDYPYPVVGAVRRLAMAAAGVALFWVIARCVRKGAGASSGRRLVLAISMVAGGSACWSVAAFALAHVGQRPALEAAGTVGAARELALDAAAVAGFFAAWVALVVALDYRGALAEIRSVGRAASRDDGGLKRSGAEQAPSCGRYLWVPTARGHARLPLDEVEYFEADHDYVRVHSSSGRFLLHSTLRKVTEDFGSQGFMRVHRSFVVNAARIAELQRRGRGLLELLLLSGARVPVGRTRSCLINLMDEWPGRKG